MELSSKQLAQFNKDGYLILRNFLDASRCDTILSVAKRHLSQHIEPIETELGYNSQSKASRTEETNYASNGDKVAVVRRLRQVYTRDRLFQEWMEDESIRPILQQILEDQVVVITAHHNSIMTKMPYVSSATFWHQDRRYWRYSDNNLISVWLALDEEHSDNGVLEFIPASHKMTFKPEQFDAKEYLSEMNEANKSLINTRVSTDLQKGDVVLFHSLLLHRANKNSTAHTKISFVYTVKGAKTVALKGTRSSEFPEIVLPKSSIRLFLS